MINLTFVKGDRETEDLNPVSQAILEVGSATSIFDPIVCEIAYRWFCPPGGTVLVTLGVARPVASASSKALMTSLH